MEKIRKGLERAEEEGATSHRQAKQKFNKWLLE